MEFLLVLNYKDYFLFIGFIFELLLKENRRFIVWLYLLFFNEWEILKYMWNLESFRIVIYDLFSFGMFFFFRNMKLKLCKLVNCSLFIFYIYIEKVIYWLWYFFYLDNSGVILDRVVDRLLVMWFFKFCLFRVW